MRRIVSISLCTVLAAAVPTQADLISNPWSGVAGDRANIMGFAFRADAGNFPSSVTPSGTLPDTILLTKVTFTRPAATTPTETTPVFGTGPRQTTDANTPIFLEVYTGADAATDSFSGFLGSSSTSVAWSATTASTAYSFDFANLPLDKSTKYWFVFSEDNVDGEFSNFRLRVNTSGNNTTAGPGQGYLVGDTFQILDQAGTARDWGTEYEVEFTAVPESSLAIVALGMLGVLIGVARHLKSSRIEAPSNHAAGCVAATWGDVTPSLAGQSKDAG